MIGSCFKSSKKKQLAEAAVRFLNAVVKIAAMPWVIYFFHHLNFQVLWSCLYGTYV